MVCILTGVSASATQIHNSVNTGSTKWAAGWGITGGQYGQFTCTTCHTMNTSNIKRIKSTITAPSGSFPGGAVVFNSMTSFGNDAGGHTTSKHVCEVCHSKNKYHNYNTTNNTGGTIHNNNADCTLCHQHNQAFKPGESPGGVSCGQCHSDLYNSASTAYSMHNGTAGINYKHYMDNDTAAYSILLPNGNSTNVTSRRCLMCHVDHDKFKVSNRAANLRVYANISTATNPKSSRTNTDITLCVSCHYSLSTKYVAGPNGETQSMQIPFQGLSFQNATTLVKTSTHGYAVLSQTFKDSSSFNATCNKCHNDTIGKNGGTGEGNKSGMNGQNGSVAGRYKFGNHMSTQNNMYSVLSNSFYQGTAASGAASTLTVSGTPWTTDQWKNFAIVITGGTGAGQRKIITTNTTSVATISGTWTTIPDGTSSFDIVKNPQQTENVCFACHSKAGQNKPSGTAGLDWYGQQPMKSNLEGIKNLFIGDTGSVTTGGAGSFTDSSKSGVWTVNKWAGYSLRYESGALAGQTRIIQSNDATGYVTLTPIIRYTEPTIAAGTNYTIFRPATHPIDDFGRHASSERISPAPGWNTGDTGSDTLQATQGSVTTINDAKRLWNANVFVNMTAYFPNLGVTRLITANGANTLTLASAVTINPGEAYYIGSSAGKRHVACADCHNSHAAQDKPEGAVTGGTTTTVVAAADGVNPRWPNNQWKDYLIRVRSTSGLEQIRYVTSYTAATGTFTVSLPFTTAPGTAGDTFEVLTESKYLAGGPDSGRAGGGSTGVWGVRVSGFSAPTLGSLAAGSSLTYTKFENSADRSGAFGGYTSNKNGQLGIGQKDLCLKCHGYYAYKTSFPAAASQMIYSTSKYRPVTETDTATEFNPYNVAHHAVFARGKNQPIRANYGSTTLTSVYNASWPMVTGTVSVGSDGAGRNGYATLSGATLPNTAVPGWFMHIGTLPGSGTAHAATTTTGWVEIIQIVDTTHFYVRRETGGTWPFVTWDTGLSGISSQTANITAGLGNAFVPPYGPWSVLRCTDCHGSSKTDPVGPHSSVNQWLIKDADVNLKFQWYNSGSVTQVSYSSVWGGARNAEKRYFCFNCHRADVYGTVAVATAKTLTVTNDAQSRLPHGIMWGQDGNHIATDMTLAFTGSGGSMPTNWPQYCRHCHGGDQMGGIHGSNLTNGPYGDAVPQSTRFLNGATWTLGFQRPTTSSLNGACYTQSGITTVSYCNKHPAPTGKTYTTTRYATYDY
ncbi:hypothetical protein [Geobacter pickeringii]|nr:hypothetical protein [Geobacter pickeringii]